MGGYLDSASGIPPSPAVSAGLMAGLRQGWPDPGRRYAGAGRSRQLLDQARAAVARTVGAPADGVFFAGSRDEAIHWVLTGYLGGRAPGTGRVLMSAVEDLAFLRAGDRLRAAGMDVVEVPVDATATVDVARIGDLGTPPGTVVVVQDGNLEVGTRQPLPAIRAALPEGVPLVTDATAVLGRVPLRAGWDALVAEPRMWGSPGGFAVVAVREPDRFAPDVARTEGFRGLEPAQPPVALIATAALALEEAVAAPARWQLAPLTDRLRSAVPERIADVQVLGHPTSRLPYLTMLSFLYVPADELVDELARRGWSVASGASCTSDTRRPHHVLVAMGALTHGSLRVSVGPWTTLEEIDAFVADLVAVVARIREESGASGL